MGTPPPPNFVLAASGLPEHGACGCCALQLIHLNIITHLFNSIVMLHQPLPGVRRSCRAATL
eukprot:6206789-Pleurochrysis_carterae.AAC.9